MPCPYCETSPQAQTVQTKNRVIKETVRECYCENCDRVWEDLHRVVQDWEVTPSKTLGLATRITAWERRINRGDYSIT